MPLLPRLSFGITTAGLTVSAAPLFAHPGHLAGLAGHDHWVAGAAIGAAIAIGLYGALKGKKAQKGTEDSAEPDTAEAEA